MQVRVADYIAARLVELGVRHVFLLTGGGAMHLNDAFGRAKGLTWIACHHEQTCAMAAEAYFRIHNRVAAVNVTTGPGGTNAITGVWGAFVDSVGMIVVSGQVKWETVVRSVPSLPLRQLGDQEIDIAKLVAPITKYSVMVTDPQSIRYHIERAFHLATTGRPGPVWIDVPMNVQGALVDPSTLPAYAPAEDALELPSRTDLRAACAQALERLSTAKRPVILAGGGVWMSGTHRQFLALVDRLGIPVTTGWNANDLIWNDHPLYAGRPGTVGDRAGNFAVQNSDFLLVLGSRLNIRQISYGWKNFARAAYKVMVDVDAAEMQKPTLTIDLPIHADLKDAFAAFQELPAPKENPAHREWLAWCQARQKKYPVVLPEYWKTKDVNPYCFMDALFRELPENQVVISGDGTACVTSFQAATIKRGQRLFTNSGSAPMGFDLPGAIGACFALEKQRVVCLAGDGSIQLNLQDLATIALHRLPIKIFVLNNRGYHSIRQTQQNYFPDNVVGCGTESGLGFPDFEKIAEAYRIPYRVIRNHETLTEGIRGAIAGDGPSMCEVVLDLAQQFAPKLSSRRLPDGRMVSSPLEDLAPFLDREELAENLLIPPVET